MVVNTQFHKFYGRSKKWRGIFRVAAEVCSSQTRLGLRTFFETFMHVYVRTLRTTKYIQGKKKKRKPPRRSGVGMDMYLCAKIQGVSLGQKRRGH